MENEEQERQEYDLKYVIFLDCHDQKGCNKATQAQLLSFLNSV